MTDLPTGAHASLPCCKNDDCTILYYCDNIKVGKHEWFGALQFYVNFIKLCVLKTVQNENFLITQFHKKSTAYNIISKPQPPIEQASNEKFRSFKNK